MMEENLFLNVEWSPVKHTAFRKNVTKKVRNKE